VPRIFVAALLATSVLVATQPARPARAAIQANPVDCFVENLNPQVPVGVQGNYVVHLSGGLGT
jgi:hypothetical protein